MPTILTTKAQEDGSYLVTINFTNEDGDAVTPNAGTFTWTLTDEHGTAISNGDITEIVEAAEAAELNHLISATDLDVSEALDPWRLYKTYAEYDSNYGSDLPTTAVAKFQIEKLTPAARVVTLEEAKEHLRIDSSNTTHDNYVMRCIRVAERYAENYQHRKLLTTTVTKYIDDWTGDDPNFYLPDKDGFYLPYGQLQSVTSIKYTDSDNDQSTWAATEYDVDSSNDPGLVRLAYDKTWPTVTLAPTNPIEIIYVCGYGDTGEDVPFETKQGILIFISDLFEQRESFVVGQSIRDAWIIGNIGIVNQFLDLNKLWKFG